MTTGINYGSLMHQAMRGLIRTVLEDVQRDGLPGDHHFFITFDTGHPDVEIVLIESGGDNLSATFSPELADVTIYVIDVAAGEEIPRKGGPAITRSDILVINKTDLAPHVGADLSVMDRDARQMRQDRPFVFCEIKNRVGVDPILDHLRSIAGL